MHKVLLVDDDENTNFLSKMVLNTAGFNDIREVLNGQEAYEQIEQDCPDIIFLDINMPVMDGWEFLDEKKTKAPCKHVKIVLLTSSTFVEDKKRAVRYPCVVDYIVKPLTQEKVKQIKVKLA